MCRRIFSTRPSVAILACAYFSAVVLVQRPFFLGIQKITSSFSCSEEPGRNFSSFHFQSKSFFFVFYIYLFLFFFIYFLVFLCFFLFFTFFSFSSFLFLSEFLSFPTSSATKGRHHFIRTLARTNYSKGGRPRGRFVSRGEIKVGGNI